MSASGFLLLLISAMIGCAAPQAPCLTTENILKENNIKLKWKDKNTLQSSHGSTVEFQCKPGYSFPDGTKMRVKCENGKINYPKCYNWACMTSENILEANNIKLKWKDQNTLKSSHRSTIEFQCKPGYDFPNGTKMRVKCENGKINYPKCYNWAQTCGGSNEPRRECGFNAISSGECRRRNCCFDSRSSAAKCFYNMAQNEAQCSVSPLRRRLCGEPVANARACYDRGCCFNSSLSRDKWCFAPKKPTNECGGIPYLRRQCGPARISAADCRRRKCCYDSSTRGAISCFHNRTQNNILCAVSPLDRTQCGHTGITARECYNRGCCFDASLPGATWCYSSIEQLPCQTTKNDLDGNNIKLKWRDANTLESPHGDTVEFECKPGFVAQPGTPMRVPCLNGKIDFPICYKSG